MRSYKKIATAALVGAAALAMPLVSAGTASAADVGRYLQGDTVYFSTSALNCSITPASVVGCDIPGGGFLTQVPFTPKVYDVAIDVPWFPAHPTFGVGGPRGRAGSPQLEGSITYGGATCEYGFKGLVSCSSMGRSFNYWTPYLTVA